MPPGATPIVPASDDPVSIPTKLPFMRTIPDGKAVVTVPLTLVPFCASVQVIFAVVPLTSTEALHVPATFSVESGAIVVFDSVQPAAAAATTSSMTPTHPRMT